MFGKPAWFRERKSSWGLTPVTWRGWAYAVAWTLVIGLPFMLLVGRHQGLEAAIWMVCGVGALVHDVRKILGVVRNAAFADARADVPEVMYIGPEGCCQRRAGE